MSFLKITDPTKRDQTVKEYLELKKNIRDNLLSERAGEQQLQTELTKFYRPITESQKATTKEITESQKATAREITEGLRPIREGIEKLPQAMQPIGEASGKKLEEEEEDELIGDIAIKYLRLDDKVKDKTFGINKIDGHHHIGDTHVIIHKNNIIIDNEKFTGTPGLWDLIMLKDPPEKDYSEKEYKNYARILIKTHVLHQGNNPNNPYPKSSKSYKWNRFLRHIWEYRGAEFEGEGVIIMSSDPNALLERLDLLLASQKAGHTGVGNELVSICDELKRQGILDTTAYKKINSIIKNDST